MDHALLIIESLEIKVDKIAHRIALILPYHSKLVAPNQLPISSERPSSPLLVQRSGSDVFAI